MKNVRFIYIFISILLAIATYSCSDENEIVEKEDEKETEYDSNTFITQKAISQVITEWGESTDYVLANMKEHDITASEEDFLLFNGKEANQSISYQFYEGGLCTAVLIIPANTPSTDIQSALTEYIYLGNQGETSIYLNQDKNTVVATYKENSHQVIGFTPITSSVFENLPPLIVTTDDAKNIDYVSATVSGSIEGIKDVDTPKIYIYYDTNPIFPASTNKTKEMLFGNNLSTTLSGLTQGTTYYYCIAICLNDIYYYGDIKSFTTLKEKTYTIGDFYPNAVSPEGVVFYIENSGTHGKIVSLDNKKNLKWDNNGIFCTHYGNTNSVDGSKNTMPKSSSLAGGWCYDHGTGWYCPAKGELINLDKAIEKVNATLSSKGYDTINGIFWASTEYANNEAYIVCVSAKGYMGYTGGWNGYNTKNQNNSVCAVKKF